MQKRWAIPTTFAVICFLLAGVSVVLTRTGNVGKIEKRLDAGQTVTTKGLELQKDRLYTLHIIPAGGVALNETHDVSAALTRDDGVVFEVADSYWHQRGVWREGGESGTWEEQNAQTEFEFRVPETGKYDLEITLDSSNSSIGLPFRAAVTWKEPWFLSMWPLLLGGFALLGISAFSVYSAGSAYAKMLQEVGAGSRLKYGGEEFEVLERSEHWEGTDRVGVDLRCRSGTGIERWISISSWWRENPFDDDHGQTLWQVYVGVPLNEQERTLLDSATPGGVGTTIRGRSMRLDRDNSGGGTLVTEKNGEVYTAPYYNWAYRNPSRIPLNPGEMWLECTVWRQNNEPEWWLSRLVDWREVEIVDEKPGRLIGYAEIQKARSNPDPFRVRTEQAKDPFGMGQQAVAKSGLDFVPPTPTGQQPGGPQQPQQQWQPPSQNQQNQPGQTGQQNWQPPAPNDDEPDVQGQQHRQGGWNNDSDDSDWN